MTYVKLAACFQGQEQVYERLEELAQVEAEIILSFQVDPECITEHHSLCTESRRISHSEV